MTRYAHYCAVVISCLGMLNGCTVGPDYKLPLSALFNGASEKGSFVSQRGEPAFSGAPVPDNWWRLYKDSRLDGLISHAIAANTDLRIAAANLERSRALLQEARTLREPGVVLNGGVEYGQTADRKSVV